MKYEIKKKNKLKFGGFKIKNEILSYDIISFQTSRCYCLEFISNLRVSSVLILTHFKPMFHFYAERYKISESSGFLMSEVIRNGTLAKLDYQQNWCLVLSLLS